MANCPYCGKKIKEGERYCWHCENDVSGIVDKEEAPKCFIATAAYGTPFAREVGILRNFRDKKLRKNFIGIVFIKFYYKTSPAVAKIISKNKFLKKIVRIALKPAVKFAEKIN
ncbi:hypothetical protein J4458_03005 [Candidatus Woesearchaeota archaeon]|nr:hypothetical protein [Candidatus Woesearchaeota archaeon]